MAAALPAMSFDGHAVTQWVHVAAYTMQHSRCGSRSTRPGHGLVIQVRLGFPGAVTFCEDEVSWIPSVNQPLLLVRGKQDFVQLKQPSADSFSLWMRSKTMVTICFPILGFRFLSLGPDPRET
jgi:hypothetical protein